MADAVEKATALIATALSGGHKVMLCGNGGSAADSQHLAVIRATESARAGEIQVIGLLGRDGGALRALCDVPIGARVGAHPATRPEVEQ